MAVRSGRHSLPPLSTPERAIATFLRVYVNIALVVVAIPFLISLVPGVPNHIRPADVPHYWELSAAQFVAVTNTATGWGWLAGLPNADVVTELSLAVLAATMILGFFVALVAYLREHDTHYLLFSIISLVLLAFAASGLI